MKMTKAQYITWLFRRAQIEDNHDASRNYILKLAMTVGAK